MCRERFGKLLALGDRAGRRWEKQRKVRVTALVWDGVMRWRWLGQVENGIIFDLNMSGEMHMWRRSEVFGCMPHGARAYREKGLSLQRGLTP